MKINILKDMDLYKNLEQYNSIIKDVSKKYFITKDDAVVEWFNPDKYRELPLSRTYPETSPELLRPEYSLIMFLSNYVPLFLINLLYKDNKDILIEEFGGGIGRLMLFLSKLGFKNFNNIDNFSQTIKPFFQEMMTAGNINAKINDLSFQPKIVINTGAPFFYITYGLDPYETFKSYSEHKPSPEIDLEQAKKRKLTELELICFYNNIQWADLASLILAPQGFKYLCKDSDEMGIAWCRKDKHKEFTEKLKPYEC